MVLGIILLAFGIVAAGVTAIFHDKYSTIFGAWETALTNVWFIAFVALVGVGALISLGYPLLIAIGAGLWVLLSKDEPEVIEEQPISETSVVKGVAPTVEENAPAIELPERIIINEARLRDIFGSVFMHEWLDEENSISYLDQLIEDLQYVRDHFKKAAKQDDQHYCINNIIEIAYLLDKPEYVKKPFGSFPKLCRAVFDCMRLTRPKSIKNHPVVAEHVKKRFSYLL